MSVDGAVALGRRAAEARMASRVDIVRLTGRSTLNSVGRQVPTSSSVATAVPFRLAGSGDSDGGTRTVTVDGVEYEQATALAHLPATTANLNDNDLLHVTSGEWAGSWWRVVKAVRGDQKTARRVPIVEGDAP